MSNRAHTAGCVVALLLAATALNALQQKPARDRSIRFGDIVLSGFETAELELGAKARATGPSTVVDAVDADRKTTAQLRAREIVAFMSRDKTAAAGGRGAERVDKITAEGGVRFSAVRRPDPKAGDQTVKATGSRAVYDRAKQVLTLSGPVSFAAEQPSPGGKGADKVTGTAERAVFDEAKQILQLSGEVEAKVITPDTPEEGSTVTGDEVKIEMAEQPYRVSIVNASMKGSVNIRVRAPEPGSKPDGKKP
jgi:lipopolysaccharide export system protein LptA